MTVALIAAKAENGVIGREGELPWHLPADLKHFKALTTGHAIVMGRKTFESIGRLLPDRRTVIVTRNPNYQQEGATVVRRFEDAVTLGETEDIFVIGGAEIFRRSLPLADRLYLTVVHATLAGDVLFPDLDEDEWNLVDDEYHEANGKNRYAYSFQRWERRRRGET
jgi:dihydrofolate reductase